MQLQIVVKCQFFSGHSVLSKAGFQQHCQLTPRSLMGQEQVNTRWKAEKVLYIICIQPPVRYQLEQHQI
jgi:hypothetical protein